MSVSNLQIAQAAIRRHCALSTPLELGIYFAALTMRIAASEETKGPRTIAAELAALLPSDEEWALLRPTLQKTIANDRRGYSAASLSFIGNPAAGQN